MRILVDTNVILDIILERKQFLDDSKKSIIKAINSGDRLFFSSSAVIDVFYVVHKITGSREKALEGIITMSAFMDFAEVNEKCILNALVSDMNDFEDSVIDSVASYIKADMILTRNVSDFTNSKISAVCPYDYVNE